MSIEKEANNLMVQIFILIKSILFIIAAIIMFIRLNFIAGCLFLIVNNLSYIGHMLNGIRGSIKEVKNV